MRKYMYARLNADSGFLNCVGGVTCMHAMNQYEGKSATSFSNEESHELWGFLIILSFYGVIILQLQITCIIQDN